ncbi:hypothetical protein HMPREF0262_03173 [Clostridium sp. ATCC 29733]|nr:hypothetical protein HMPREF0262_03173 [Clostridium sp. ATCC 29733]
MKAGTVSFALGPNSSGLFGPFFFAQPAKKGANGAPKCGRAVY